MSSSSFEYTLLFHAAPVLAGIKPAALLSFSRKTYPHLSALVKKYSQSLQKEGLSLRIACRCKQHSLLLVYRPRLLQEYLAQADVRDCLARFGYPKETPPHTLKHLCFRLRETHGFPHEIGLFLGYPPQDVLAFAGEISAPCLLCGYWKVYFNVEKARQIFAQYDRCRDVYCNAYRKGYTVSQILRLSPLSA